MTATAAAVLLLGVGAATAGELRIEGKPPEAAPAQAQAVPAPATAAQAAPVVMAAVQAPAQPAVPAPVVEQRKEFYVAEMDRTVRDVLQRWASQSGWRFGPEHWGVDRDLPIYGQAGPDMFGGDFHHAVRTLLKTTELSDRPVQPCFHPNKVLRVISRNASCFPGFQIETPSRPVDMGAVVIKPE